MNEYYLKITTKSNSTKMSLYPILHKFLTILDKDSIKYLDYFLENEFKDPDLDIFENVLKLMQNACSNLKKDFKPTIKKVFHLYYSSVKSLPLPVETISDIDRNVKLYCLLFIVNLIV